MGWPELGLLFSFLVDEFYPDPEPIFPNKENTLMPEWAGEYKPAQRAQLEKN